MNPDGPPVTANVKGELNSPFIVTFKLPLSELLQVSLRCSKVKVSLGKGLGSQASPKPSLSKSS